MTYNWKTMTCNKNRQDPDISIRKRALDVTYSLVDEANIKSMTKVGSFQKSDEKCWSIKGTWLRFLSLMFVRLLFFFLNLEFDVAGTPLYFQDYEGQDMSRFFLVRCTPCRHHTRHLLTPRSCWTICWWPNLTSRTVKTVVTSCHLTFADVLKKMFLQTLAVYFKDLEQQTHTNTLPRYMIYIYRNIHV